MVILMRMNMPSEYRMIISEVLGDLEFSFYHKWFDRIFLVGLGCWENAGGLITLIHLRRFCR